MNDRLPHTGWVGGRPPLPHDPGLSEQLTRIAAVDPITGQAACGTERPEKRSEATVALSLNGRSGVAPQPAWPEFSPTEGRRGRDLETRVWTQGRKRSAGAAARRFLPGLRKRAGANPASLAIACLICAAAGGLAIWRLDGIGHLSRAIRAEEAGQMHSGQEALVAAQRSPAPGTAQALERPEQSHGHPSLGRAVDALIDGRLDEALAEYRLLAERHPENPAYALTVDILTASERRDAP